MIFQSLKEERDIKKLISQIYVRQLAINSALLGLSNVTHLKALSSGCLEMIQSLANTISPHDGKAESRDGD